jgi:hypothetical protein
MVEAAAIRAATGAMPWRAVAALAIAAGSFIAGWSANGWRTDSRIDRLIAQQAEERGAQAHAVVIATNSARMEEQRRIAEQTEIANAATKDAQSARMAARDAHAAANRLRQRVTELVAASRTGGHSATALGGASTDDPIGVLADVLGRADRRAGILAEYADSARIAGVACERAYDALSQPRAELQSGG